MTGFIRMLVYIVLMSSVWRPGETFILDTPSQCVVAPPCTCSSDSIDCYSKGLTSIPTIMPFSTSPSSTLYIKMQVNRISNIPANAFQNVTTANATSISLSLYMNTITTISDQAFNGIENEITSLYLQFNKLTSIPTAIGHLVNLHHLNVHNNPLRAVDAQVLVKINRNLHSLYISFGNMTSWDDGIHVLRELQTLNIDHSNLRSLPVNAFHGFGTSLQWLSLTHTMLDRIPESICNLKYLQRFDFKYNSFYNGNISLQNLCPAPLTEVSLVFLIDDGIHTFPDGIFSTFPHLKTLSLDHNKLRYISYESVPASNELTALELSYNLFSSIPSAVDRFQRLQTLYMYGNQIYAIEHYDLVGLFHLSELYMHLTPLEYIDPVAFQNQNNTLIHLGLRSTHLVTIPSAVTSLSRLSYLSFNTNPRIECSCDNLSHLRSWNVTQVTIDGNCEFTNETIKDFILTSLPHCPVK